MKSGFAAIVSLGLLILLTSARPAFAGDSFYGKVTHVTRADLVTLDNGSARFQILIIGIDVPREGPMTARAKEFVTSLVLGKNARARFEGRRKSGEMASQLLTDDPEIGIKDVGVELVRAGLARRLQDREGDNFGYKYGEVAQAENEARKARRGVWAGTRPK